MVSVNCPSGDLAVEESVECTASYISTEEDVAAGNIRNTATASAGGVTSDSDSFEVVFEGTPALSLTKSASPTNHTNPGELTVYTFTVTNIGNVPINSVTVQDPMPDESRGCDAAVTLQPGASLQCNGYYTIKGGNANQTINNCASASGMYKEQKISSPEACVDIYYQASAPPPEKKEKPVDCDANPGHQDC